MRFRSHDGYLIHILEQMTKKTEKTGILFYLFYEEYSILTEKARAMRDFCKNPVQNAQYIYQMGGITYV